MADEIAKLNQAIKFAVADGDSAERPATTAATCCSTSCRSLAQVSVTDNGDGSINVTFGDAATAARRRRSTVTWPQALTAPGGKLGALHRPDRAGTATPPAPRVLPRRPERLRQAAGRQTSTRCTTRAGTGTNFFTYGAAGTEAATLAVNVDRHRRRATPPAPRPAPNDIAIAIAKLRGRAPTSSYQALVARIGSDVRNTERLEANAKVLTGAIDDRRQSIAGVSMDEEMTNLVRFQRGYQASRPRDERGRRDARPADQPHRTGGSLMTMRLSNQMLARNTLADLHGRLERALRHAAQDVVGQGDHAARPTIRSARPAR